MKSKVRRKLPRALLLLTLLFPFIFFPSAMASTPLSNGCGWNTSPGWIARENAKAGNADWAKGIPRQYGGDDMMSIKTVVALPPVAGPKKPVEGWFDSPSGTCGSQLGLHLSGNGRAVTIKIYRMGYYGGAGARLITATKIDAVKPGVHPLISPAPTSTVSTQWPVAWILKVNRATIPGQYLVKLDDGGPRSTFVPLTIEDPQIKSSITFVSSILTWQAYNQWGGYSLYKGPDGQRETRGTVVSFNRPYDGDGSGQFRYMEYPILKIAERLGLDMNYITDIDVDQNAPSLRNTKTILYGGHGEYWTTNMRQTIQGAVDRGVNFVSLGGNAAYARPRLQANNRELVMWRSSLADPNRDQPILATTGWRENPILQPESMLLGAQYVGLGIEADYSIPHPDRWPFTAIKGPAILKGIVGREVDSPLYAVGPAVETLASAAISLNGASMTAMATYYTNASHAGVIDISTNGWTCAIDDICPWHPTIPNDTRTNVQLVTQEILKGASFGPLGFWRPAIIDIPRRDLPLAL